MAARAMNVPAMMSPVTRRSVAGITPEFYFPKTIDNSRLVRVADPQRRRELRSFSAVLSLLFLLASFYTLQHFRSVQYGYRIEAQKREREQLMEENRKLALERSTLRDPKRIVEAARLLNLQPPAPGQVVPLESGTPGSGPVLAEVSAATI